MKDGRGLLYGIGAIALVALGVFVLRGGGGIWSALGKVVLWGTGAIAVAIASIVVLVIVLALRPSKKRVNAPEGTVASFLDQDAKEKLTAANRQLSTLRVMAQRIRNPEVRQLSRDVCEHIHQLLSTLRSKPETLSKARQYLSYYLPALEKVLNKYGEMERAGVVDESMTQKVINYLNNIQTATDQQHSNLFDADVLDMTVEMDVMTTLFKRDGLLSDLDLTFETEDFDEGETGSDSFPG